MSAEILPSTGLGIRREVQWHDEGDSRMRQNLAWQAAALCAQTDPEAHFPEKGGSTRDAKKICNSCDVKDECLEYALDNDERFGIWGGMSERERRKLKAARNGGRQAVAAAVQPAELPDVFEFERPA